MKRILYLILFLIPALSFANVQDEMSRAEALYEQQNYDSVLCIYKTLIDQDYESADLYYNLANAYFKKNELAYAILFYEKAFLLNPHDEQIKHNLKYANAQQVDKVDSISTGFVTKWYESVYRLASVSVWTVLTILFFILCLVGVYVFLFSQTVKHKKISFYSAILLVLFSFATFMFAKSRNKELTAQEYAIVVEPTVSVKTEPKYSSKDFTVVHSGLKVQIVQEVKDWYFVRLDDGNKGWLPKIYIERI